MSRFKMLGMGDVSQVPGVYLSRAINAGSLDMAQENYTRGLVLKDGTQDSVGRWRRWGTAKSRL